MKDTKPESAAERKLRISLEWGASLTRALVNNAESRDRAQCMRNLEAWAKGAEILIKSSELPDPAAVYGIAHSLETFAHKQMAGEISEAYQGADQFMREIMKVGEQFETWACAHVDFTALDDVWPYLLQDKFAAALEAVAAQDDRTVIGVLHLDNLNPSHWPLIAKELGLKLNAEA